MFAPLAMDRRNVHRHRWRTEKAAPTGDQAGGDHGRGSTRQIDEVAVMPEAPIVSTPDPPVGEPAKKVTIDGAVAPPFVHHKTGQRVVTEEIENGTAVESRHVARGDPLPEHSS